MTERAVSTTWYDADKGEVLTLSVSNVHSVIGTSTGKFYWESPAAVVTVEQNKRRLFIEFLRTLMGRG